MSQEPSAGKVLLRVGIRGIAAGLPGGVIVGALFEEVAMPFCEAAWTYLRGQPQAQQQEALGALAQLPVPEARELAEEELATFAPGTRERLVDYLSAVPMSARRAVSRPDDAGRPSVLLSQLPRGQDSLLAFLPLRPPRFRPGHRVPAHDLELDLLLGQGGFGEVWRARHLLRRSQPPRALKFCLEPAMQVSLERELELLDRIEAEGRHEGIVQLLGTALSADPPFLTYEYVDGGDLAAWLASFEGRPAPAREVVRVLCMACEALAFAHERGIVHLDLKPANLLVTREGRLKVADFGIGRVVSENEARRTDGSLLRAATALQGACTPLYADRAQQRGQAVDARADVYALGVVAYQILMGDVTLALPSYWRDELDERGVPGGLLDVLGGCLSLPARRLPHAGAVLAELKKLRPIPAAPRPDTPLPVPRGPAAGVLSCPECGRPFRSAESLARHAAAHQAQQVQTPVPGGRRTGEMAVLEGADLKRTIDVGRRSQLPFTSRGVQSADVIAHMAAAVDVPLPQAAAAVDAFWDYVADVRSHYRQTRRPYLVIPGFGTFQLRDAPRRPGHKTLGFRSQSAVYRRGRMVAIPGEGGKRLIAWSRAAMQGASAARQAQPAAKAQSWYTKLAGFLGASPPAPEPAAAPASAGPATGPIPVQPMSLGWTSTAAKGRAPRERLSVRRRIAVHVSEAAGLPLPTAARLLDAMLQVVQLVFDRPGTQLTWAKRGVMLPAPGGAIYRFRCYPSFAERLRF
jgi:hypothetical protein